MSDNNRQLSSWELREAIITGEELALQEREAAKPKQTEQDAIKMLVDAFGVKAISQTAPFIQQLGKEFTKVRERRTKPTRLLDKMPFSNDGLQRSRFKFWMRRDWEK